MNRGSRPPINMLFLAPLLALILSGAACVRAEATVRPLSPFSSFDVKNASFYAFPTSAMALLDRNASQRNDQTTVHRKTFRFKDKISAAGRRLSSTIQWMKTHPDHVAETAIVLGAAYKLGAKGWKHEKDAALLQEYHRRRRLTGETYYSPDDKRFFNDYPTYTWRSVEAPFTNGDAFVHAFERAVARSFNQDGSDQVRVAFQREFEDHSFRDWSRSELWQSVRHLPEMKSDVDYLWLLRNAHGIYQPPLKINGVYNVEQSLKARYMDRFEAVKATRAFSNGQGHGASTVSHNSRNILKYWQAPKDYTMGDEIMCTLEAFIEAETHPERRSRAEACRAALQLVREHQFRIMMTETHFSAAKSRLASFLKDVPMMERFRRVKLDFRTMRTPYEKPAPKPKPRTPPTSPKYKAHADTGPSFFSWSSNGPPPTAKNSGNGRLNVNHARSHLLTRLVGLNAVVSIPFPGRAPLSAEDLRMLLDNVGGLQPVNVVDAAKETLRTFAATEPGHFVYFYNDPSFLGRPHFNVGMSEKKHTVAFFVLHASLIGSRTAAEAKKATRSLLRKVHPDKNVNNPFKLVIDFHDLSTMIEGLKMHA